MAARVRSVLVEGLSDQRAVEALAERRGRDLDAERVSVVPIGARKRSDVLEDVRLGLHEAGRRVAMREEGDFRRGLERAGIG